MHGDVARRTLHHWEACICLSLFIMSSTFSLLFRWPFLFPIGQTYLWERPFLYRPISTENGTIWKHQPIVLISFTDFSDFSIYSSTGRIAANMTKLAKNQGPIVLHIPISVVLPQSAVPSNLGPMQVMADVLIGTNIAASVPNRSRISTHVVLYTWSQTLSSSSMTVALYIPYPVDVVQCTSISMNSLSDQSPMLLFITSKNAQVFIRWRYSAVFQRGARIPDRVRYVIFQFHVHTET